MRGLIVHEWIESHGGSENVLEQIAQEFPEARIQCLWNNAGDRFDSQRVDETWLARSPLRHSKSLALPFMPMTWRSLGPAEADWILCSSHLFSHHAKFAGGARSAKKYVYVHSPARYLWTPDLDTRGRSWPVKTAAVPLRMLDRGRAQEATAIASNSEFVRQRVQATWRRDTTVIYPPVDVKTFASTISEHEVTDEEARQLEQLPDVFILGASRFVEYKRLDLVIRMGQINSIPVVLAGDGPERAALEEQAAGSPGLVTFIRRPSLPMLRALYKRALVLVFPAIEDFGIMPVEAMATGTPVIGPNKGGVSESVLNGLTGRLLDDFSDSAMRGIVHEVESLDPEACRERAWEFDASVFRSKIRTWVEQ